MKHYAVFSEAIREGAKLRPQAYLDLLSADGGSCALGAGLEAIGVLTSNHSCYALDLAEAYPYMNNEHGTCPVCGEGGFLRSIVIHLNDGHRWTRERIADWLSDEEEKLGFVLVVEPEEKRELVTV